MQRAVHKAMIYRRPILLVLLPFAGGYFLSYFYRTINAVISAELSSTMHLRASGLGLLTAVYFLSFAAMQLPLGIALDRYGPRRVQGVLLLVAAIGAALFGSAQTLAGFIIGRALIGLGVAAALIAGLKSIRMWFPKEQLPLLNGCFIMLGTLGALTATAPAELIVAWIGWRALFAGLAAATAACAAVIVVLSREPVGGGPQPALGVVSLKQIYTSQRANAFNATLYDKLGFNFIRDIVPVASIDRAPFVMVVNPSSPAQTVAEFIAYAKANTGKINLGASGPGSPSQLYGELFKTMAGIDMAAVQYRGVASALPDLMSGRLDVIFLPVATAVGQINAAKVRALGVTSSKRVAVLPDVPAIGDTVAGYEAVGWTGIGAPAKTPDDIVTTLNRHVNAALADATFKARLAEVGLEPFASTPSEFAEFIAEQTEKWGKIIRAVGIKPE